MSANGRLLEMLLTCRTPDSERQRGAMQMARPVLCTCRLLRVETSKICKFCSFWDWQNPQENALHSEVEDILWWDSFRCNYDEYIVHSQVHIYATGCYDLSLLDGLNVENLGLLVSCWSHQRLTFATLGSPKIIPQKRNVLVVETWCNSIRWIYIFFGVFFWGISRNLVLVMVKWWSRVTRCCSTGIFWRKHAPDTGRMITGRPKMVLREGFYFLRVIKYASMINLFTLLP